MKRHAPTGMWRAGRRLILALCVSLGAAGTSWAGDAMTGTWIGSGGQYRERLHTMTQNGEWVEVRAAEAYAFPEMPACRIAVNQLVGRFRFVGVDRDGHRRYEGQWIGWAVSGGTCSLSGPEGQYTAALLPGADGFQRPPLPYGPDNMINIYTGAVPASMGLPFSANWGFYRKTGSETAAPAPAGDAMTGTWIGSGGQYRERLHTMTQNGEWIEVRAAEAYAFPEMPACHIAMNQLVGRFRFVGMDRDGHRRYEGQWIGWAVSGETCSLSGPEGQYTAALLPGADGFQRPPLPYGPDHMINIYTGAVPASMGLPFSANWGFYRKTGTAAGGQ